MAKSLTLNFVSIRPWTKVQVLMERVGGSQGGICKEGEGEWGVTCRVGDTCRGANMQVAFSSGYGIEVKEAGC